MNKLLKNLSLLAFVFSMSIVQGQPLNKEYRTMNGKMTITGKVGDSTLMMNSSRLLITLNYETAELVIRVNKDFIKQEYDGAIKAGNMENANANILFKGKLGLDYVITEKHPPLNFDVEGYLYNREDRTMVKGTGQLVHIHANEYACLLNMDFEVDPELLAVDWPGDEKVKIQIIQTVLKPSTD